MIKKRLRFVFFPALIFFFIVSLFLFSKYQTGSIDTKRITSVDTGWDISINSRKIPASDITHLHLSDIKKGDKVSMTVKIPKYDEVESYCLVFPSNYAAVSVSINGASVYSFYEDAIERDMIGPKNYNVVAISPENDGSVITIDQTATADDAFTGLGPVYTGNFNDIWLMLIGNRFLQMFSGLFLVLLGMLMTIILPYLNFKVRFMNIFFLIISMLDCGVYLLCYSDVMVLLTHGSYDLYLVEYYSFYCMAACILGLIISEHPKESFIYERLFEIINILFPVLAAIITNVSDYSLVDLLIPYYGLFGIESVCIIISTIIHSRNKRLASKNSMYGNGRRVNFTLFGLVFYTLCNMATIIRQLMHNTHGTSLSFTNHGSEMAIGIIVLSLCFLMSYFVNDIDRAYEQTEKEKIEGLAYTDKLTGFSNRARVSQLLSSDYLSVRGYSIISIDLDHLKYVNDNFGHSAGDKLLSDFAALLKDVFSNAFVLGRMGGDEFIAVVPDMRTTKITEQMYELRRGCEKLSENSPFKYEFSWGSAGTPDDPDGTPQDIFNLADNQMYEMKQKHHAMQRKEAGSGEIR